VPISFPELRLVSLEVLHEQQRFERNFNALTDEVQNDELASSALLKQYRGAEEVLTFPVPLSWRSTAGRSR
jgi:hypothetical protein